MSIVVISILYHTRRVCFLQRQSNHTFQVWYGSLTSKLPTSINSDYLIIF